MQNLVVHRLIKDIISGKKPALYNEDELGKIASHISTMERVAMEAERDFYKIKAIRFMEGKTGKIYDGLITGVSSFGIFVQIKKFGVEGLIRYADMDDDYYMFEEANYSAYGKKKKKRYTMGDNVRVEVRKVNIARGFLDLIFTE